MITKLRRVWNEYWFAPVSPRRLGLCRILFFAGVFWFYYGYDMSKLGNTAEEFYKPVYILRKLHMPLASPRTLLKIEMWFRVALALSCVGFCTRIATVAALGLGVYVIGLPNSFGKVGHGDAILVWAMLAMACSRCGDACSVDALIVRWWKRWRWARRQRSPETGAAMTNVLPPLAPAPSGDYMWPIRFMWFVMGTIFFSAGVAKLRTSGFNWIASDTMTNQLMAQHYPGSGQSFLAKYFGYNGGVGKLGLWIAGKPWIARTMAAMTLVIELSMILAPFIRRVRLVLVPLMALCQVGMGVILGVLHPPFALCYLFWVPWERWLRLPARLRKPAAAVEAPAAELSAVAQPREATV